MYTQDTVKISTRIPTSRLDSSLTQLLSSPSIDEDDLWMVSHTDNVLESDTFSLVVIGFDVAVSVEVGFKAVAVVLVVKFVRSRSDTFLLDAVTVVVVGGVFGGIGTFSSLVVDIIVRDVVEVVVAAPPEQHKNKMVAHNNIPATTPPRENIIVMFPTDNKKQQEESEREEEREDFFSRYYTVFFFFLFRCYYFSSSFSFTLLLCVILVFRFFINISSLNYNFLFFTKFFKQEDFSIKKECRYSLLYYKSLYLLLFLYSSVLPFLLLSFRYDGYMNNL